MEAFMREADRQAVRRLAEIGAPAVDPVLRAMSGPYPKGRHPRDVVEALAEVLIELARRDPQPLIDVLQQTAAPASTHLYELVESLAHADEHKVADVLISTLRHPDKWIRSSAAAALVKLRSKRAKLPLIEALKDRSSDVKSVVVFAMQSSAFLRDVRAVGPLSRIVASQSLQKHTPGLCEAAQDLISKIERTASTRRRG